MKRSARNDGFTLIELLIAVALMIILVSAITMIFVNTTETVAISEARMAVYTNARYALGVVRDDLLGAFSVTTPASPAAPGGPPPPPGPGGGTVIPNQGISLQRFYMDNGVLMTPGSPATYNIDGSHHDKAGDRICFRTTTTVADTMMTCEVLYELMPGSKAVNSKPGGADQDGDLTHQKGLRTDRGLYTLVRRVRVPNPKAITLDPKAAWDFPAQVKEKATGTLTDVVDQELCHYVISFNVEYLASNGTFAQLQPSPCPKGDPLGDGSGPNDLATPYRIPAVRITLVIVDDNGERQERTIQQTMWIPQM